MKKLVMMIVVLVLSPTIAIAAPREVLLFPGGAIITETLTHKEMSDSVRFLIPESADPNTLRVGLDSPLDQQKILGIDISSVLPEISPYADLVKRIEVLMQEIGAVEDRIKSRKTALDYWVERIPPATHKVEELQKVGTMIREETEQLYRETSLLTYEKQQLIKELQEAERELNDKTSQLKRKWQVVVHLQEPIRDPLSLSAQYKVRNAGWSSSYILNARPEEKIIEWGWTAGITQQTGLDWEQVHLKLATREPIVTLTPPPLPGWTIEEQNFEKVTKAAPRNLLMGSAAISSGIVATTPDEPVREQGLLFDIYDLGIRNVKSGTPIQMEIRSGQWNSEFTYLARPLQSSQAFIDGKIQPGDEFFPLPTGKASIRIDDVHVGQRPFSLYHLEETSISFGNDPSIQIDVKGAHKAGEKGLLNKEKTYDWNWSISVTNHKSIPITLRIEDDIPHIAHQHIQFKERYQPPLPDRDDNALYWNLLLTSGERKTLKYGYSITYPKDMIVAPGR
ncbi:MAG: DUF4139 domain-containing protein [Anaerolineales bacterium]